MNQQRTIRQLLRSKPTIEGAGVHLKRVFGFPEAPRLDPFLLLDDFGSDDPQRYMLWYRQTGGGATPYKGMSKERTDYDEQWFKERERSK